MTEGAEFSKRVAISEIGDLPSRQTVSASEAECAAVALRLDLAKLTGFTAEIVLQWKNAVELSVKGLVAGEVTQHCVVTGAPVVAGINDDFDLRFGVGMKPPEADLIIDGEDDEPPEPLVGPMIDIGEIAVQQLSLALNPYPRAPGIGFQAVETAEGDSDDAPKREAKGPFAALDKLRHRLKE